MTEVEQYANAMHNASNSSHLRNTTIFINANFGQILYEIVAPILFGSVTVPGVIGITLC
jgi:hypothetical protein